MCLQFKKKLLFNQKWILVTTAVTADKDYISAGFGTSGLPPSRTGGSGWGEGAGICGKTVPHPSGFR